jgi:16S rRNA (cytidine1402-2'-O)-methyltransferase
MNKLKELEKKAFNERQTQIFMETPYRNNKLIQEIIKTCHPGTNLCIAANITTPGENIRTKTIAEWKKEIPDLHKIPCIFLLESKGY